MYNREQIYEALRNQIPYIARHENTERVMSATNALLDQLIIIQEGEEEMRLAKEFNEIVGATDGNVCTDTE